MISLSTIRAVQPATEIDLQQAFLQIRQDS
jgi:hypothetical protein